MARVFGKRPTSALARRAPSRAAQRKARKHKVVMESVTQEKKKLRSVISFEAKAPPGYTFIPAGNPQLTTACKEMCRRYGSKVFAVSTTPHMNAHNLSQHVHRIGYHFPSTIVSTVCMDLGLYLTATGNVVNGLGPIDRGRTNSVDQITINTEARDAMRDLFPNIPDNDLNQIIKTAFQKGQHKVGTAVELPLARRAQLAVVAHIRHIYTDYDRLLKTTSFHEARSTVEQPTLAKVIEWRGDDENGKTVLEDVFREVIVISDDEDTDTEEDVVPADNRDLSVEIIASNARAEELQTRTVNFANPSVRESIREFSEDEAPPGFRFIPEVPKKNKIDRRGFSRYQAWDRAINRYRNANGTDQSRPCDGSEHWRPIHTLPQPREPGRMPRHVSAAPVQRRVLNPLDRLPPLPESREYELPPRYIPLERVPPNENILSQGDSNAPVFVSGPEVREKDGQFGRPRPKVTHGHTIDTQDRVLPSIELPPSPLEIRRPGSSRMEQLADRISGGFQLGSAPPHHPRDISEDVSNQAAKRRRMAYEPGYESRPDIVPVKPVATQAFKDAYTGEHFIPLGHPGQLTAQDDPRIRRENVPVDLRSRPDRAQDYPIYANAPELMSRRHIDDARYDQGYTRLSPAYSHVPSASYAVPVDVFNRAIPAYSAGSGPYHVIRNDRNLNDGQRQLTAPHPAWKNASDHAFVSNPTPRRQIYSEDFVRPVDAHEPEPLEYTVRRPRYRTSRVAEMPQPTSIRVLNDREHPPSGMVSIHPGPHVDPRAHHVHDYTILNSDPAHGNRLLDPTAARPYERPQGVIQPGPTHHRQPNPLRAPDHHPVYVRRVEQPPPRVPEGRTVVIVD